MAEAVAKKEDKTLTDRPCVLVSRRNFPDIAYFLLSECCDLDVWPESTAIPRTHFLKMCEGKTALFVLPSEKIDREVFVAAGPKLKVVSTMSLGYDHIDIAEARKRGIKVGFIPNVLTMAVAEHTIALLLNTTRRLFEARRAIADGLWPQAFDPEFMLGMGLQGLIVGIVGLGNVGQAVARMLKPFGVHQILYTGRSGPKKEGDELEALFVSFEDLLKSSDAVLVTCALNEQTKGMFNRAAFKRMKMNAVLINTSRGNIVDQNALIEALTNRDIAGAGLDVMVPEPLPLDHALSLIPNCVLSPHLGTSTMQTRHLMATVAADNILCCLHKQPMPFRVCTCQ